MYGKKLLRSCKHNCASHKTARLEYDRHHSTVPYTLHIFPHISFASLILCSILSTFSNGLLSTLLCSTTTLYNITENLRLLCGCITRQTFFIPIHIYVHSAFQRHLLLSFLIPLLPACVAMLWPQNHTRIIHTYMHNRVSLTAHYYDFYYVFGEILVSYVRGIDKSFILFCSSLFIFIHLYLLYLSCIFHLYTLLE